MRETHARGPSQQQPSAPIQTPLRSSSHLSKEQRSAVLKPSFLFGSHSFCRPRFQTPAASAVTSPISPTTRRRALLLESPRALRPQLSWPIIPTPHHTIRSHLPPTSSTSTAPMKRTSPPFRPAWPASTLLQDASCIPACTASCASDAPYRWKLPFVPHAGIPLCRSSLWSCPPLPSQFLLPTSKEPVLRTMKS